MRKAYIADDGKEFATEQECRLYEDSLKAEKCPSCRGRGGVTVDDGHDCWGNYETRYEYCLVCKGTGIKDKNWQARKDLLDKIDKLQRELSLL